MACFCEKLLCSCLTYYLVCEAKRRWGGRLLVVYVEVLQVKKDVQNLNAIFMVQWLAQVERLLCRSRAVYFARCTIFTLSIVTCML